MLMLHLERFTFFADELQLQMLGRSFYRALQTTLRALSRALASLRLEICGLVPGTSTLDVWSIVDDLVTG